MPRFNVKHTMPDGTDRYLIWSTDVAAPVSRGLTLAELHERWKAECGPIHAGALIEATTRPDFEFRTLESVIAGNRAGARETSLTLDQIVERYIVYPHEITRPPLGETLNAAGIALAVDLEQRAARAQAIIAELVADIQGRAGIGAELDAIDEETREDMIDEWRAIVLRYLPMGQP